jgi:hypothetical protein
MYPLLLIVSSDCSLFLFESVLLSGCDFEVSILEGALVGPKPGISGRQMRPE